MLGARGIIPEEDAAEIARGLDLVAAEYEADGVPEDAALEDIHMHVEHRLTELIGPAAGRLHTARSRNDQVATDFKMWVRAALEDVEEALRQLSIALVNRAEEHSETIMPGFTHLQVAQPVTLGHHLMAYCEMFRRDRSRLADARARADECPLGSAALAGTSYPLDREATARALGFAQPTANSLDSVSDRDFALDYLMAATQVALHLSRLAEELVIWASQPFGFVTLSDQWSTGSSIMPQKRNPDAAELVRGKAGRVFGALQALLTMMKGLPLTYSKDMQEDKEGTFDALQTLSLCLAATAGMVRDMQPDLKVMKKAAGLGYATATDLADWLVRVLKMPFRDAHHVTGRLVGIASEKKVGLEKLSLAEMQAVEPQITEAVFAVLGVDQSVKSRVSYGGTAPANVRKQARRWLKQLSK